MCGSGAVRVEAVSIMNPWGLLLPRNDWPLSTATEQNEKMACEKKTKVLPPPQKEKQPVGLMEGVRTASKETGAVR